MTQQPDHAIVPHRTQQVIEEYRALTPVSVSAHESAKRVMPGGETRSVAVYPPHPLSIVDGAGSRVVDADGNSYLDLVNNYTSLVHGNAYPPVVAALAEASGRGIIFPSTHSAQQEWAEMITQRVASIDTVRFTNSGSEANVLALRIARRHTGRRKVVVCEGSYHGSLPSLLEGEPEVISVPFNDPEALMDALDETVAAVFAEPFLGAGGVIPADQEFLHAMAGRARGVGAVFVLDEVQALRNAYHGQQHEYDLSPDLTTLGKVIGGGLPVGAVGGRVELMVLTAAETQNRVVHAGTFNGHLLAAAAGKVTLAHLDHAAIERMNMQAETLANGIERVAPVPVSVTRAGSILNVHFSSTVPRNVADVRRAPAEANSMLQLALALEGVFVTPRGFINLSTVLTDVEIDDAIAGYERAFDRLFGER